MHILFVLTFFVQTLITFLSSELKSSAKICPRKTFSVVVSLSSPFTHPQAPSHPQKWRAQTHSTHISCRPSTHRHTHSVSAIHHSAHLPPPPLLSARSRCASTEGAQSHSVSQPLSPQSESETPPVCLSACIFNSQSYNPLPRCGPARKPRWWLRKLEDSEGM